MESQFKTPLRTSRNPIDETMNETIAMYKEQAHEKNYILHTNKNVEQNT